MILSDTSVIDLKWWIKNIESSFKWLSHGDPSLSLYSDASKEGWGAVCKGDKSGGRWTVTESNCHINEFETLAALFALKSFCHSMKNSDINIYRYVSWRPDPEAQFVDAFSCSWSQEQFYAFPPFTLILRCLKKTKMEDGEGIIIVPVWPTQPWYPKLMSLNGEHQ